ncbi:capsid protein [Paenibacillus sp. 7884-2]|nr:capsid protein [Paenibacillus sp. 7884-2]
MDFLDRLQDKVNSLQLPIILQQGYLGSDESFVVYPLPGGRTVTEYMDGTKDRILNFEFAMKSKRQSVINPTLWMVQNVLDELEELESKDGSFEFEYLTITNTPFINQIDEQGWFVFLLDVQANITVFKEELANG